MRYGIFNYGILVYYILSFEERARQGESKYALGVIGGEGVPDLRTITLREITTRSRFIYLYTISVRSPSQISVASKFEIVAQTFPNILSLGLYPAAFTLCSEQK